LRKKPAFLILLFLSSSFTISSSCMSLQNDASGSKENYAVEEMTFALEEEVFQAPDILGPSALEEINTLSESKNKGSDKAETRGDKKRKSSEKPAEKKV
jgi:HIV Tat-specific factor 1